MLRVKEALVGPSERWFGRERGENRQKGQASPFRSNWSASEPVQPHPKQKAAEFWLSSRMLMTYADQWKTLKAFIIIYTSFTSFVFWFWKLSKREKGSGGRNSPGKFSNLKQPRLRTRAEKKYIFVGPTAEHHQPDWITFSRTLRWLCKCKPHKLSRFFPPFTQENKFLVIKVPGIRSDADAQCQEKCAF